MIGMRANRGDRVEVNDPAKVDLIKAGFSVAAIPVREHIWGDQVADPSADSPGRLFFFFAGDAAEGTLEILVQIHEVVIGEHADGPIAPPTTGGAELVVATADDHAEQTAADCSSLGCDLSSEEFNG